jgi:putative N-acetyltransferase (TIGR04045 family)
MAAAAIDVHWAVAPEEVRGALSVREQVFCDEQGVARADELDGRDEDARHVVALTSERYARSRVIGTARLLVEGRVAKIGRVAVEREWRGHGIASRMLALTLDGAREHGCRRARLASQLEASELYRRAGFAVESDPFEEAGIQHIWMGLQLGSGRKSDHRNLID